MKRVIMILSAGIAAALFAGIVAADEKPNANYQAALNAITAQRGTADAAAAAWADAIKERFTQQPAALEACAKQKSEVGQVICSLAVTGNLGGGQAFAPPAQMASQAPPAVPMPPPEEEHWFLRGVKGTFSGALAIADRWLGWKGIAEGRRERVQLAEIQGNTQLGMFQTFGQFGQSSVAAVAGVSRDALQTMGGMQQPSYTYTYNVPGYANFGSGDFQLWLNSFNRRCTGGQAAAGGNAQGTTGASYAGQGAPGGNASC